MRKTKFNSKTYRAPLGEEINLLLFELTDDNNNISLNSNLHPKDILQRYVIEKYKAAHPEKYALLNIKMKPYHLDLDL